LSESASFTVTSSDTGNPGVTVSAAYTLQIDVADPPTITGISPGSGPTAGGTVVTITGTDLATVGTVTFGGTMAASFTVDSTTQITATTPAGAAGAVDVGVVAFGGSFTQVDGFTYVAPASTDATLSGLQPSAGTLDPAFDPGTLDYSLAVGNEIDSLVVTPTAADAAATIAVDGQAVGSGMASQTIPLAVGTTNVQVVVTAEDGTTVIEYALSVTRAPLVRPDPSEDPEVMALLNAQASSVRRMAQSQITNFHRRLEQLHNEGDRRTSSMDVRLGITQVDRSSQAERQIEQMIAAGHGGGAETGAPDVLSYAPQGSGLAGDDTTAGRGAEPDSRLAMPDFGPFAVWTGGFVNFGERESGGLDLDSTMVGVSGGIDYRFSDRFVGGFGAGYGLDQTDIGGSDQDHALGMKFGLMF
jgi:hypothetical protein